MCISLLPAAAERDGVGKGVASVAEKVEASGGEEEGQGEAAGWGEVKVEVAEQEAMAGLVAMEAAGADAEAREASEG